MLRTEEFIDFSVVCDESNNTDSVIDRNMFNIRETNRSINFIHSTLSFQVALSLKKSTEQFGRNNGNNRSI